MGTLLTQFFYLPVTIYHISNLLKKKKTCNSSIFLILVIITKFIDLKSKTKYTSPPPLPKKEESQQQKLPVKLKTKLNSINSFYPK